MTDYYGYYSDTLTLSGDGWAPRTIAFFAGDILAFAVLAPCLLLAPIYKWQNNGRTDIMRTLLFVISTLTMIIYYILDITNTAVTEANTTVHYNYYILPIFAQLVYRIAELLILIVILRTLTVLHSLFSVSPPSRYVGAIAMIAVTAVVSAATFGMYAAYYGYIAAQNFDMGNLTDPLTGLSVAYWAVYLLTAVVLLVLAGRPDMLRRSKASVLMLFVTICLVVRALFFLIDTAVLNYSTTTDYESLLNFNVATEWIYDLATVGIYVGVTVVALMGEDRVLGPGLRGGVEVGQYRSPHVQP